MRFDHIFLLLAVNPSQTLLSRLGTVGENTVLTSDVCIVKSGLAHHFSYILWSYLLFSMCPLTS